MIEIGKWYRTAGMQEVGYVYYFIYDDKPGDTLCGVFLDSGEHFETTEYSQLGDVVLVDKHPKFDPIIFNREVIEDAFSGELYD